MTAVTQVPLCNPFQFLPLLSSLYKGDYSVPRLFILNCSMYIPLNKMDTILVFVWAAVTQYRMGSFTINRFISHSSRDWKSELRAPAWMGEGLFQVADFLYLDVVEGEASSLESLL